MNDSERLLRAVDLPEVIRRLKVLHGLQQSPNSTPSKAVEFLEDYQQMINELANKHMPKHEEVPSEEKQVLYKNHKKVFMRPMAQPPKMVVVMRDQLEHFINTAGATCLTGRPDDDLSVREADDVLELHERALEELGRMTKEWLQAFEDAYPNGTPGT